MNKKLLPLLFLSILCYTTTAQNTVTGNVFRYNDAPIADVLLDVNGQTALTNNDGYYELDWADAMTAQLTGHKVADYSEGINMLDIVAIRHFILGMSTLQTAQIIAGDVNDTGGVTTYDIVLIQRHIQGISYGFDDFPNWIFIPEECNTMSWPSNCPIDVDLNSDNDGIQNFVGILKGDVISDDDFPINTTIQPTFALEQTSVCSNDIYVHCIAQNYSPEIAGFQFSVRWDAGNLNYQDLLINEDIGLNAASFSDDTTDEGILTIAHLDWNGLNEASIQTGDILFTLVFSSDGDLNDESVIFDNAPTPALTTTWDLSLAETTFIDATVNENVGGISAVDISVTDASNSNSVDGSIDVENITGGLPPYTITIDSNPNSIDLPAGEYILEITDATGCTWTETVLINATVGLLDVVENDWIRINKNPIATGTAPEIMLSNSEFKIDNYLIINNLGQIIQEIKLNNTSNLSLDVAPIEIPGIYWFIAKNDEQIARLPFIVQ